MPVQPQRFQFDLPNGAVLQLQSVEEVEYLQQSADMLARDYEFEKFNDRVLLGALLSQQLNLYRAQQTLTKTVGKAPGEITAQEYGSASKRLLESAEEIRALEKALGIDKKTRDSGGQHDIANYIRNLKRAAHDYGVHISERTLAYENFANDLRVKLRILDNADNEDRAHHNISEESILSYVRDQLQHLEEIDQHFAKQKGKVWAGKL